MRIRHTVAAVCGALALTAVLAAPADAAAGDFSYRFLAANGDVRSATLQDPLTETCVTLPEVADPGTSVPAFAPHNDTGDYALVFTGPNCTGESWLLRPHGRPATDLLTLRSVLLLPV
ncbi:hypothetical protein [Streptomyces sp. NPDC053367]|uniref:hypothetical protein n=1 Tax=Streptomyces sp. NPDC053367 TaxID=3365700 RepID=UPI0037D10DD1